MNNRAASLLAVIAAAFVAAGPSQAASTAPGSAKDGAKSPGVSPAVYAVLKQAQDLAAQSPPDYAGALAKTKEAEALPSLTPYDNYETKNLEYQLEGETRDYVAAAAACEAAFKSNLWTPEEKGPLLKALVQLTHQNKDDVKAQAYADQYLKEIGPDFDVEAVVVDIALAKGDATKALTQAQDLITKATASGTVVKEPWWRLLLMSGNAAKNDDAVRTALFGLAENYPTKEAWHDLAGNLYNKSGRTNVYALDCLRLMDGAGAVLNSEEYLSMASLAITIGLPGEAKEIVKSGEAAKLLPGKDKAGLTALKKQIDHDTKGQPGNLDAADMQAAAGLSGASDVSIGEEFAAYGMYDKAVAAINRGLGKAASLKTPDEARISLGWVEFLAGKFDDAMTAFQAVKTDPRSMDLAKAWLVLLKSKTSPPATAPKP